MKTEVAVGLSVGLAIIICLLSYGLVKTIDAAVFGFIATLLLIGLIHIWRHTEPDD